MAISRLLPSLLVIACVAAPARAAPPSSTNPGGGTSRMHEHHIDLETPEPGPAQGRRFHMHDGFYARGAFGFGMLASEVRFPAADPADSARGSSLALDAFVGGTPSPGVSLGGALFLESELLGGAGMHSGADDLRDTRSALLGPFVDAFPEHQGGWHFGAAAGLALSRSELADSGATVNTRGIGGAIWGGHDFWIAGDWSLGPLLRIAGMRTFGSENGADVDGWAQSFTLTLSILYQ